MSEKTKDCSTCNYKPSFSDTCRSCHAYSNWDWRGPEPKKEPSFNEELKAIQRMIEYRYGTHSPMTSTEREEVMKTSWLAECVYGMIDILIKKEGAK